MVCSKERGFGGCRCSRFRWLWPPSLSSQTTTPEGYTFYVAPHSHIDVVWYWTYDQTAVMCIDIMKHALDMMRKDPRFTFTQDQMMAIKPFWNSLNPDDKEFLLRMVRERRFELASGNYLQPDEAESDFESLVRQFYPALSWMETTFSTKVSTAWNIDTYGHTVQMPQLFHKAGLKYFVFHTRRSSVLAGFDQEPVLLGGPRRQQDPQLLAFGKLLAGLAWDERKSSQVRRS